MSSTAIIIGTAVACDLLEGQLGFAASAPVVLGRVHVGGGLSATSTPILGALEQLESIVATRRPAIALITLPSQMTMPNKIRQSTRDTARRWPPG